MGTKKILFIRRDNIGDLILTTPAIHAVRKRFPDAKIGVLVNSYNADAIMNNSDVDEVYVYEKEKHAERESRFSVWLKNLKLILRIRKERYDIAIGCGYRYSPRLARYTFLTGARTRIGYVPMGKKSFSYNLPVDELSETLHEVDAAFNLIRPLGITGEHGNLILIPSDDERENILKYLKSKGPNCNNIVAVHISSRKENNRWARDNFIELGNALIKKYNVMPLILWSPGSSKNPFHHGDDDMANEIESRMSSKPVLYRTTRLKELIAAVSLCRMVICCDGGAMHIAAALNKPILTIWGSTDKRRWSPWNVPNIILQKGTSVNEITVQEVLTAFERLWNEKGGNCFA